MIDDRRALLWLCCLSALGCEPTSRHDGPGRELPLASSKVIDFLQPSADRERLFFLTDLNPKKESATLNVVTADGAFTPLAALVYQPRPGAAEPEAAPSPWWDEQPLHPRRAAPAYQVAADGHRALALLQRYGRRSAVLAVFDAESGAMATVAADVEPRDFLLEPSGEGVYFLAGADTLYFASGPGQERVEIAAAVSSPLARSPAGDLLTFLVGCPSKDPPQCRLALARADGSPAQVLSANAGGRPGDLVFDAHEQRLLFPEDVQYVSGLWGLLPAALTSASVSEGRVVRLAPHVAAGADRFSPDGRWVDALADPREDGARPVVGALQLVPSTGGEPVEVAPEAGAEVHFSPDSKHLYFLEPSRGSSATLERAAVPPDPDTEPTQVATQVAGMRESPGGSELLFLSGFHAGTGTLRLLSLLSGQSVVLGRDAVSGSYRFSPDGRTVYWAAVPSRPAGLAPPDSVLRGAMPRLASDGADLYGAAAPNWAPVLLTAGLVERKYYPLPDGSAVLSFPRLAKDRGEAAAVLSFLDGTRLTLEHGVPQLWSTPDEPAFSPSGELVAFFASVHGESGSGPGSGMLEVVRVGGGPTAADAGDRSSRIVGGLEHVRTFVWLARDHLLAVVDRRGRGREESLVPVSLVP